MRPAIETLRNIIERMDAIPCFKKDCPKCDAAAAIIAADRKQVREAAFHEVVAFLNEGLDIFYDSAVEAVVQTIERKYLSKEKA